MCLKTSYREIWYPHKKSPKYTILKQNFETVTTFLRKSFSISQNSLKIKKTHILIFWCTHHNLSFDVWIIAADHQVKNLNVCDQNYNDDAVNTIPQSSIALLAW